eukprot:4617710-Amphidinium_carterae.2
MKSSDPQTLGLPMNDCARLLVPSRLWFGLLFEHKRASKRNCDSRHMAKTCKDSKRVFSTLQCKRDRHIAEGATQEEN